MSNNKSKVGVVRVTRGEWTYLLNVREKTCLNFLRSKYTAKVYHTANILIRIYHGDGGHGISSSNSSPYRAEYCKTNRAKCKKCGDIMQANTLKLANMTKSRFHDGYDANYYHVECFFRLKRPNSVAEIRHFETLKYEDQKLLEKAIETNGKSVLSGTSEEGTTPAKKGKGATKRGAPPADDGTLYEDFQVEYAKSGRATCKVCEQKIEKSVVRLGKMDYSAETPANIGPVPRWYHTDCFAKSLDMLQFYGQISKIKGFSELEKEDQKMLKSKIKPTQPSKDQVSPKKVKSESDEQEEKLLKKQSDRFFALREHVNSMKRKDIEEMLACMKQKTDYKASSILIDMATDILLFGPLEKCPECKQKGGMVLRGSSYICTRKTSSDEDCTYETDDPKRGLVNVPEEICDKYDFFSTYKFRGGKRIFPSKFLAAVKQKEAENNNLALGDAPLDGLNIGVISWSALKNDKTKIQKKVTTLGGKIVTALDRSIFVILTNKNELEKETPKIEVAKALDIPMVTDDFIFSIQTRDDVASQVSKYLINDWKGDIGSRIDELRAKAKANEDNNNQISASSSVES